MSFTTYLLTSFCAISLIEAVPWDGAQSTSPTSSLSWNLNPTPAPLLGRDAGLLRSNDLRRRQIQGELCGYVSGTLSRPLPCARVPVVRSVCTPFSSLSVLGCCDEWGGSQCDVYTDCIDYYEYSVLCLNSSVSCPTTTMTKTCTKTSHPYCLRYTYSGYSIYACNSYPTVESLSMTFFSSLATSTQPSPNSTTATTTTTHINESPTSTTPACPNRICNPVSPGTIAGSALGGLMVLVMGAVGLTLLLRQNRYR